MKKVIILLFVLLIIILVFILVNYNFTHVASYRVTYTSAVCDGNTCQDVVFTCLDGEVVESSPISGFVTFDDDWVDERENRDLC